METKRSSVNEEQGISFTPKINKRSSTLERSVENLYQWKEMKDAKSQYISQMAD